MVAAAKALVPNLKTVALVGDPYERQPFRKHFSEELTELAGELDIINLLGWPMDELKQRVAALPADSAIIYVPLYVDGNGGTYISRDALGQISKVANRPIVSDVATHIGFGSTGGLISVPGPVAEATASLTLRILNGQNPANIPITVGTPAKPIFDWRQLQRFGISENSLPPGSEIRYRAHSLWEEYRSQMLVIFAALCQHPSLMKSHNR
jgi:ABC-type uncharacterized transport system substrate-binding protein